MPELVSPALLTLIEKAATDAGFDTSSQVGVGWLGFASTHAPLRVWVGSAGEGLRLALSMAPVAEALRSEGAKDAGAAALPAGAVQALTAVGVQQLYGLLRRAFALSRSLPDTPLQRFKAATATMPRATEAERLVVQRVGQDVFRESLLDYWSGRCAVSGLAVPELLRASHIKPWSDCKTDDERLDVFNGLLLAPHLDAAFDRGFITFRDDGVLIVSPRLSLDDRRILGLEGQHRISSLGDGHRRYLSSHRASLFKT